MSVKAVNAIISFQDKSSIIATYWCPMSRLITGKYGRQNATLLTQQLHHQRRRNHCEVKHDRCGDCQLTYDLSITSAASSSVPSTVDCSAASPGLNLICSEINRITNHSPLLLSLDLGTPQPVTTNSTSRYFGYA